MELWKKQLHMTLFCKNRHLVIPSWGRKTKNAVFILFLYTVHCPSYSMKNNIFEWLISYKTSAVDKNLISRGQATWPMASRPPATWPLALNQRMMHPDKTQTNKAYLKERLGEKVGNGVSYSMESDHWYLVTSLFFMLFKDWCAISTKNIYKNKSMKHSRLSCQLINDKRNVLDCSPLRKPRH